MKFVTIPDDIFPIDTNKKRAIAIIGEGKRAKKEPVRWIFLSWVENTLVNDPKLEESSAYQKMCADIEVKVEDCREEGKGFIQFSDDEYTMLMIVVDLPTGGYGNRPTQYGDGGSIIVGGGRQMVPFIRAMEKASDTKPASTNKRSTKKKTAKKAKAKAKPATKKAAAKKSNRASMN